MKELPAAVGAPDTNFSGWPVTDVEAGGVFNI